MAIQTYYVKRTATLDNNFSLRSCVVVEKGVTFFIAMADVLNDGRESWFIVCVYCCF